MKKIIFLFFFVCACNVSFAQDTLPYFILRGKFIVPKQASLKFNKGDSVSFPYFEGGNSKLCKQLFDDCTTSMGLRKCGLVTANVFFNSDGTLDSVRLFDELRSTRGDVHHVSTDALNSAKYAFKKMRPWVPFKINGKGQPFIVRIVVPYGSSFTINSSGQTSATYSEGMENDPNSLKCLSIETSQISDRDDFFAMGVKLMTSKNFEEAALWFGAVLESNEKDLDALFNRAICYLKTNDIKSACKDWERAAKLGDPDAPTLIQKNCK